MAGSDSQQPRYPPDRFEFPAKAKFRTDRLISPGAASPAAAASADPNNVIATAAAFAAAAAAMEAAAAQQQQMAVDGGAVAVPENADVAMMQAAPAAPADAAASSSTSCPSSPSAAAGTWIVLCGFLSVYRAACRLLPDSTSPVAVVSPRGAQSGREKVTIVTGHNCLPPAPTGGQKLRLV